MLAATMAAISIGCGGAADNTAANNATPQRDPNKPSADPTAEAMIDLDKAMYTAFFKGDSAFFDRMLADNFVVLHDGKRMGKADEVKMVAGLKCDIKDWSLTEPNLIKLDNDNYALTYKSTVDGECTVDGKKMKVPSPTRAATIWTRVEQTWRGVFHSETAFAGAVAEAAKNAPKPADAKPAATDGAAPKDSGSRDAETRKTAPALANKTAEVKEAPAPPARSANSEALVAKHTAGWEAFKSRDAKWFNDNMTIGMGLIDPMGGFTVGRDNVTKTWTETMKCEGMTAVSFADGFASSISPTVELLTGKGTADGTCDGQPNGSLYQAAVYVKEGDAWKLAFMTESPAK